MDSSADPDQPKERTTNLYSPSLQLTKEAEGVGKFRQLVGSVNVLRGDIGRHGSLAKVDHRLRHLFDLTWHLRLFLHPVRV